MKHFEGRVAVVTGAGSGIGKEVALQLAGEGATVVAADWHEADAKITAEIIRARGSNASSYVVDVSDSDMVFQLAADVQKAYGAADLLVNNAGIMIKPVDFDDVPDGEFERLAAVNLWGVVHCTRAFLPQLRSRPRANIVNISSLGGIIGMMTQVPYSTIKFAVRGFSEALRMELHETGIRVCVVFPGVVKSNIVGNCTGYTEDEKAAVTRKVEATRQMATDAAAARILKGVRKGKPRVLLGPETYAMDYIVRLAPAGYSKMLYRPMRRLMSAGES